MWCSLQSDHHIEPWTIVAVIIVIIVVQKPKYFSINCRWRDRRISRDPGTVFDVLTMHRFILGYSSFQNHSRKKVHVGTKRYVYNTGIVFHVDRLPSSCLNIVWRIISEVLSPQSFCNTVSRGLPMTDACGSSKDAKTCMWPIKGLDSFWLHARWWLYSWTALFIYR